jgi:hypothetical protein
MRSYWIKLISLNSKNNTRNLEQLVELTKNIKKKAEQLRS